MKKDILQGLKNTGVFLICVLIIVYFGTREHTGWLMLVCPAMTGCFALFVVWPDVKANWKAVVGWTALGFIAGIIWHIST